MLDTDKVKKGKQLIAELSNTFCELSDEDFDEFVKDGTIDLFLKSILDPSEVSHYPNIAEFFLANKYKSSLLSYMRYSITNNYSIEVTKEGITGFVSPNYIQWFEDGVMILEGEEKFTGYMSLYKNGKLSYAIAARDAGPGESMGSEYFEFIDGEDFLTRLKQIPLGTTSILDEPIQKLKSLINITDNTEAKYQKILEDYPWVLGAQYRKILRHPKLDEKNIPDFTGVRVHDGFRDIIELKPPFMKVFREDGNFTSDFNDAWNQAERYLNFAREEKDYLLRKGMRYDNPKCYLVLGWNISKENIKEIRRKEKMNPSIQLYTYNDLLAFMESTVKFVRMLKIDDTTSNDDYSE